MHGVPELWLLRDWTVRRVTHRGHPVRSVSRRQARGGVARVSGIWEECLSQNVR
jgi:hypothetical protein